MVAVSYFKMTGSSNRLELHINKALKEIDKHDDLWFDQYIYAIRVLISKPAVGF